MKTVFGHDADLDAIRTARQILGTRPLMIDTNHGHDAIEAIRLGRAAARYDIAWFEEPVLPEHLGAYAEVRRGQPIPVAGGETWHTRHAHPQAIRAGAIDILQPDVTGCGGLTEMRRIAACAETEGIRVVAHVWGPGVHLAASLRMLALLPPVPRRHAPNDPWLDLDRTGNPFLAEIVKTPVLLEAGRVAIPPAPVSGSRSTAMRWPPGPRATWAKPSSWQKYPGGPGAKPPAGRPAPAGRNRDNLSPGRYKASSSPSPSGRAHWPQAAALP
nr:enolase C-terminal domain-like protein [Rhodovulum kholense]